jgi:hypothetical protein
MLSQPRLAVKEQLKHQRTWAGSSADTSHQGQIAIWQVMRDYLKKDAHLLVH